MTLLEEIQQDLTTNSVPLSNILRKAKILAVRLKSDSFRHWVDSELNGYADYANVPEYRKVPTQLYGNFRAGLVEYNNQPIPAGIFGEGNREFAEVQPLMNGVREIESMVESDSLGFKAILPPDYTSRILVNHGYCVQAWKLFSKSGVDLVLDTIRNRLLDFVIEIETLDPDAGEKSGSKIAPETVRQILTNNLNLSVGGDIVGRDSTNKSE